MRDAFPSSTMYGITKMIGSCFSLVFDVYLKNSPSNGIFVTCFCSEESNNPPITIVDLEVIVTTESARCNAKIGCPFTVSLVIMLGRESNLALFLVINA